MQKEVDQVPDQENTTRPKGSGKGGAQTLNSSQAKTWPLFLFWFLTPSSEA